MSFFEKFSSTKSYQYLDELIQSGKKEIILDYDIKLRTGALNKEILRYGDGIKISNDELVFDGNGHTIDGNEEANLFRINGKKVIIKNLKFKNNRFHSRLSAITIYRGSDVEIKDCIMENSTGCIHNEGVVSIDNISAKIIDNSGTMTISNPDIERIENRGILYAPDSIKEKINNDGEFYAITSKEENQYDFEYLDNLIHSGKREIKLENDIKLNISDKTITIDVDDLVIDGNGHTIDCLHNTRILEITSKNVKLKNIIFKNGNSTNGSAILNKGSVDIESCDFLNNESQSGAIYNDGEMKLEHSRLTDNNSKHDAGAIYNKGKLDIFGCVLLNNKSTDYIGGGAIYNEGELKVKESLLLGNVAKDLYNYTGQKRHGGAIYNDGGNIEIDDCCIKDNLAASGGAIYNCKGNINIIKTDIMSNGTNNSISNFGEIKVFESNISHNGILNSEVMLINNCEISDVNDGDVIINSGTLKITNNSKLENNNQTVVRNHAHAEIVDSHITNNISQYSIISNSGGLLDSEIPKDGSKSLKLINTIVSANKSGSSGVIDNSSILEIEKSTISDNTTTVSEYGIIENDGLINIMESKIVKNKDCDNVIVNNNVLKIQDSDFIKNNSKVMILNRENDVLEVFNGSFIKNIMEKTLIFNQGTCSVTESIFENNVSQNQSSRNIFNTSDLILQKPKIELDNKTIYNEGVVLLKNSPNLKNIIGGSGNIEFNEYIEEEISTKFDFTYLNNEIRKNNGNVFNLMGDITFNSYERDFFEGGIELDMDNLIIDGNGYTIDGGGKSRIFIITGKNITLKNITFRNGLINKDAFDSLNTKGSGLLIHSKSNVVIENCKFLNNNSSSIYTQNKVEIEDCEFRNNEIAIDNKGQLNINYGKFLENENGILNNNHLEIRNGNFSYNGKCIYNSNMAEITKGEFSSNEQIIINKGEIEIKDIEIYTTKSTAIQNNGKINIFNSKFGNNKDNCIKNYLRFNVNHCEFFENSHWGLGGSAIYNDDEVIINDSIFTNNTAKTGEGGAIYNNKHIEINASIFLGNNAIGELGGGAIFNYGGIIDLKECEFENNSAKHGGAIMDYGMPPNSNLGTIKRNCIFKNNRPNDSDYKYR